MRRLLLLLWFATSARALDVTGFVYRDDAAVAGVPVTASVAGNVVARGVSGDDGGFVFRDLPDGVVEISVEESSALVFTSDVISFQLGPSPDTPRRPPPAVRGEGKIKGVITVNGKPLAHAPVVLQAITEEGAAPVRVYANAKGEFEAKGLGAARYAVTPDERLRVRAPQMSRMYEAGREPFIVDLTKATEATTTIELTAPPVIRGRVVDAEGKPVAHARVQLVFASRPVLDFQHESFVRSTPEGRFALILPEWDPNEKVNVAVTAPLHSTVRSKPFPAGTTDRTVDVTLPKFENVRVRVTDRAGKPVPKARVAFTPREENENPDLLLALARSGPRAGENGQLALQLAPDTYDFAVDGEGFQAGTATKAVDKPTNVDVVLERAALIRGRVHRNGKGVANVTVMVSGGTRRRPDSQTTTDGKGAFALQGLAPGTYRIMLFHAEELIERNVEVEAPGELDVALPPAGTLRARVVDAATGEPVTEFAFQVVPAEGRGRIGRGERSEDGTFSVTVPVGTYRVHAAADGYTTSETMEVRVTEREPASIELRLGRGVTISGRVTDETGTPVANAEVLVMSRIQEAMRSRSSVRVAPGHAKSAEDGSFTVTGVDRGEAAMTVRKEGYAPFRKAIDADGTMNVDVQLSRGLSLSGIVTRGGKGVAGAQVSANSAAVGGDYQMAVSGDDGRFVLTGLVAARYSVNANAGEANAEVRNVDPSKEKELVISLDPKPRGVVFGNVAGIPPSLGGKYVRRIVLVQSSEEAAEGMIDDAGNYRVENAPIGEVFVMAHLQAAPDSTRSSVRKTVELIAGQPLRVDLELTGNVTVSGRITHEGKGLAGANIGFSSNDGTLASAVTREDGAYEVALPSAGRYTIYARAEQVADCHFSTVRDVRGGDRIDIELRESVLEGTVVDAETRQPIPHAVVTLGPALAATYAMAEMETDAQGRFRLASTFSGPHRLTASAPGYGYSVQPVSNTTTHYLFALAKAASLQVRVVDARSGTPLDAHIVLNESEGGSYVPVRYQRSTDGTTYSLSLSPSKYRLTVVVHGYTTRVVDVSAPGVVEIRME
jgi:protocatechuate 3,4-dioxygenase beta subunit